ncbi:hypothetical protein Tco_0932232 [Tanacetum coccineum]
MQTSIFLGLLGSYSIILGGPLSFFGLTTTSLPLLIFFYLLPIVTSIGCPTISDDIRDRQCARLTSAYMVVVFDEVTFPQMKGLRLKASALRFSYDTLLPQLLEVLLSHSISSLSSPSLDLGTDI